PLSGLVGHHFQIIQGSANEWIPPVFDFEISITTEIIPTEQGLDLSGHTQLDTRLIVLAELDPPALDKLNKLYKFGFRQKIPSQKIFNCKCRHPGSELAIHKCMHQP